MKRSPSLSLTDVVGPGALDSGADVETDVVEAAVDWPLDKLGKEADGETARSVLAEVHDLKPLLQSTRDARKLVSMEPSDRMPSRGLADVEPEVIDVATLACASASEVRVEEPQPGPQNQSWPQRLSTPRRTHSNHRDRVSYGD